MNSDIYAEDRKKTEYCYTLMQHLIIDQQIGEKNIFHSRTSKLINLKPTAKTKKQKSADRQKNGIPDSWKLKKLSQKENSFRSTFLMKRFFIYFLNM